MSSHSKAAAKFIADAPRTAWHDKALFAVRTKRDKMMHEVPEWEALREASSQIKRHTLSHLAHYLEEFERNATANGIVVHWAADADEMNRTVWEQIKELRRVEAQRIPADIDYSKLTGLRLEAKEKLAAVRPENLGQAARISGVNPADVAALHILLESL